MTQPPNAMRRALEAIENMTGAQQYRDTAAEIRSMVPAAATSEIYTELLTLAVRLERLAMWAQGRASKQ
jgi:hypothetical protein